MLAVRLNKTVRERASAMVRYGSRLAAIALCVGLAGCPMTLQNDVRPGRLATSGTNLAKATIVYGLDASRGPMIVSLDRYDPRPDKMGCGEAMAQTPDGLTGTTYFVFDTPPGNYIVSAPMIGEEQLRYVVPVGKQVYIGDFVVTPEGQLLSQYDPKRRLSLSRNIEAAKAALGPKANALELAEMAPSVEVIGVVGGVCMP